VIFELVVTESHEGVAVISILGELEMANAPRLRGELISLVGARNEPLIVLDLAGVDLIDATGLGVIFEGVKRTRLRGGDLALARAETQVQRELDLMRVSEILPVHPSVEEACRTLLAARA